jgi:uncharacterized protein YebE (UPF0316 family)
MRDGLYCFRKNATFALLMEFSATLFDSDLLRWVILPFLIFLARVTDVSINTVRVIYMLNGRRFLSTALGFFESFIWLLAISQILQNVTNPVSYLAYSGGFATGIYVGMLIEERLAIGNVIVRIISQRDATEMIENLRKLGLRITVLDAEGNTGPVSVVFLVSKRQELERITDIVEQTNPKAVFTVEGVKRVREITDITLDQEPLRFAFIRSLFRK